MKYFTSDTHYSHKNICRGVSTWGKTLEDGTFEVSVDSTRNFSTIEEMNQSIVDVINSTVGEFDELYHLGDWSFGGIENIWNFRKQINCKTIHLVFGNHDHHIEKNKILPNCHYSVIEIADGVYWKGKIVDGPNPQPYGPNNPNGDNSIFDVRAQDLFSSVQEILNLKIGKKLIVLSHYPMEQWRDMDLGAWHLHGHCHGTLPKSEFKRIDVGLDATEFKVLSIEDISNIMYTKINKDHYEKM